MFSLICLSFFASMGISKRLPWTDSARESSLDVAAALVLAPFFTGITTIIAMLVLPGASQTSHAILVFVVMAAGSLSYFLTSKFNCQLTSKRLGLNFVNWLLFSLLMAWLIMLIIDSVFLPLYQNDALEYAIVGRELFYARTLSIYPLLNSDINISGFYGPWTHPPLYVSLIYIFSVLQGHVDEPGLMRMISPWFLISGTFAVFMIGRLRSINTGLLSGILFISTPLLFLGASTALIDALPVVAAILLLLAICGFDYRNRSQPFALGLMLGLSLWTHSQSILFIPLLVVAVFFKYGVNDWRKAIKVVLLALLISLLIGGGPYVRNYLIFGSPVSDNPLVFGIPKLDWTGYFEFARGLDHWVAIVQYGLFKGWFSFEAYGLLFWIASLGFILFIKRSGWIAVGKVIKSGTQSNPIYGNFMWISFVMILTYLGGVALSSAMGIDLLIRNERYILIIAPFLSISSGYFIVLAVEFLWSKLSANGTIISNEFIGLLYFSLALIFSLQLFTVGYYYPWRNAFIQPKPAYLNPKELSGLSRFDHMLNTLPTDQVMGYIARKIPHDALIFSMRPADMYYANRKMISYLDPRLLPFYQESDPVLAAGMLRKLGVNYIFMPDYSLPPAYNSTLLSILSNPSLARLDYQIGMSQLYELVDDQKRLGTTIDITPGERPWSRKVQLLFGGRKALDSLVLSRKEFEGQKSRSLLPLFHRDYCVLLESQSLMSDVDLEEGSNGLISVTPGEYVVRARLSGRGYIMLWISQLDERGMSISEATADKSSVLRIGDISLTSTNNVVNFERRVRISGKTRYLTIGVQHNGKSHVVIEEMLLQSILKK
jgi:hypothetical protein